MEAGCLTVIAHWIAAGKREKKMTQELTEIDLLLVDDERISVSPRSSIFLNEVIA